MTDTHGDLNSMIELYISVLYAFLLFSINGTFYAQIIGSTSP